MSTIPFVVLALCGLAFGAERPVPRLDGRIVGGEPTTIEEYPYQLSIRNENVHFCGASIIGPYHALTAARCVKDSNPSTITLHSGTSYKNQTGQRHQAIRITSHPKYYFREYDYAVIEVSTPFPDHAVELCSVEPSIGQMTVISGWGDLSNGGEAPNQLQVVNVPIISRAVCQSKYTLNSISSRMLCVAMENGGKSACQGDTGGPLIVNGKQCGIVSWGFGCGSTRYPYVNANVADQLSWIQSIARL